MTQLSNRERYRRSVNSASVAATLTTTSQTNAQTSTTSTSWSSSSSTTTVLSSSAGASSSGLTGLSVGYGYENLDQLVPDCVMTDLLDVEKN